MAITKINGGITAPKGFLASGLNAGIKNQTKKDMAMVFSSTPCAAAGVFTSNLVKAAPVKWDKEIVTTSPYVQAVVVNSGIANACTGAEGLGYCADTAAEAAAADYNNAVAIALAAKYISEKDVNEEQIKYLQASIGELNARADKYNWDKETYRKQVEGMIERWEEQTFNERIGLGLEFGDNIVNILYKGRKKRTNVKTTSTRKGSTVKTETHTESY